MAECARNIDSDWLIGELLFQQRESLNFLKSLHFWRLFQSACGCVASDKINIGLRIYLAVLLVAESPKTTCQDLLKTKFVSTVE